MRRSGKANWLIVTGLLGVVLIAVVLVLGRQSPSTAANRFMTALATGDVETLTELSVMENDTRESIRQKWDYATKVAGPHYRFTWTTISETISGPDTATVTMLVIRNYDDPASYEERMQLPMLRRDGQWKVDVRAINRKLYPALPR